MNQPHGGRLIDRRIPSAERGEHDSLLDGVVIDVDRNHLFDLVNLADGRYSPLTGFVGRNDFRKILNDRALEDGTPWPLPVTLDVPPDVADSVSPGERVGLRGPDGAFLGYVDVDEVYRFSVERACDRLFGTDDADHPGVDLVRTKAPFLVGGDVRVFDDVTTGHRAHALTPSETRVLFEHNGWETVAGFQTRNVPHRAHEYLQKATLEHVDGLLIHPKIGEKKSGDYTDDAIIEAYHTLVEQYYPAGAVALAIFPSRMWYAGPREALFDAIVRKNHGCTHMIVGRDHAGVGDYYDDFAAQRALEAVDLGIEPMFYHYAFYCRECDGMASEKTCPHDASVRVEPSGTEIRRTFDAGDPPAPELMRPEVFDRVYNMEGKFVE